MTVDTLLRKEKEGSMYKSSNRQFFDSTNVETENERSSQNVPIRGKRKPGDAPTADGSENYYASRTNPTWQPPSSAIPSLQSKHAGLHPLVKSPTDTHPERDDDGVPIRMFRARGTGMRVQSSSPDPQPITEVQSDTVYSRA